MTLKGCDFYNLAGLRNREYNNSVKKIFTRTILILFILLISIKIVYASSGRVFGGRIINTKALQIQTLEATYNCFIPGTTIEIKSVRGPTSYMIPWSVKSKTNTTPTSGQQIIGKYSGKTSITCTLKTYPWSETTVSLDTIYLFGTSKQ